MIKKVLIAGLFLGGGYYLINKLLPTNKSSEYDLDLKEYDVKEFYRGKNTNPYGSGKIKPSIKPADKIERQNEDVGSTRVIELVGSGNCETPMCMSYGNNRGKIYL
jgi:hypothetical protein